MKVIEAGLPGLLIIEPKIHRDSRGYFVETFHEARYREQAGVGHIFVQENLSRSTRGVLRGLHAQKRHPQGKLVRVSHGEVFDVSVDINPASKTFGHWVSVILSSQNQRQAWIPPGYAHGFLVLSDVADFEYKCTELYYPEDETGVIWNDPDLSIDWPIESPIVSAKDAALPSLAELKSAS